MSVLRRLMSTRPPSPIVLLTDFGYEDQYVGTMKGVIASIAPRAPVIDLSHNVRPQHVAQGAFLLWSAYRFFPHATVFVAIVDPGVGTARRIILVKAAGRFFLAPENGLLDMVLSDEHPELCIDVAVTDSRYVLPRVSRTFHGRDVFAPVASHLVNGVPAGKFGTRIAPSRPQHAFVRSRSSERGTVLHVDRFGNIVTDIRIDNAGVLKGLEAAGRRVTTWTRTYGEAPPRTPCLMIGSSDLVEIAVRDGSAAKVLGWDIGTRLKIRWA
ncbi:MAG: SAM-dependent chlorinase/fluorinase [Ignavibacterium sp.]